MGAVATGLEIVFWSCVVLLVYAQVGYPLLLAALAARQAPARAAVAAARRHAERQPHRRGLRRGRGHRREGRATRSRSTTRASCSRSSSPATAPPTAPCPRRARAGADVVLDLPRGGKIRAQDAAVAQARGDVARVLATRTRRWEPDALRDARRRVRRPERRLRLRPGALRQRKAGTNQEGLYWRYEMALRALESKLGSITAGNGAIYATRRDAYIDVDPVMGHDLVVPVQHGQARLARGLRARRRARRRRWCRRSRASSPASGG